MNASKLTPLDDDSLAFCARYDLQKVLLLQSYAPRWHFSIIEPDGVTKATLASLLRISHDDLIYYLSIARLIHYDTNHSKWTVCNFRSGSKKLNNGTLLHDWVLKNHNIDRSKYFGADLIGTMVQSVFQKAKSIFTSFEATLKEVEGRRCEDDELESITKKYIEICTLLDDIFSKARTPTGKANREQNAELYAELQQCIDLLKVKWGDLGFSHKQPKYHGLITHLIPQMILLEGIGDFLEDFVEQTHQIGYRDDIRTKGCKSKNLIVQSNARIEEIRNNGAVKAAAERVRRVSSRNLKRHLKQENDQAKKQVKTETRQECIRDASVVPSKVKDPLGSNKYTLE